MEEKKPVKFYNTRWFSFTVIVFVLLVVGVWITGSGGAQPASETSLKPPKLPALTGFGATVAEWNAHHTADARFQSNAAYDPDPAFASGGDTGYDDQYYALLWDGGRATGYSMRFREGKPLVQTKQAVMEEFPSDATILWSRTNASDPHDACYQMEVSSPTIGKALGAAGLVLVELYTDTPPAADYSSYYDPANVNAALLNIGDYNTPADAPGC